MKINIQKLIYRIVPVISVSVILVASLATPAFATEYTVLDYNDYISNVVVDGTNDLVTVTFPSSLCGVQVNDVYGDRHFPDNNYGAMYLRRYTWGTCGYYMPGSGITRTYLDASNIPDGSVFTLSSELHLFNEVNGPVTVSGDIYAVIQYMTKDFTTISGTQAAYVDTFRLLEESKWHDNQFNITLQKPDNCAYIVVYVRFKAIQNDLDDLVEVGFNFYETKLQMSISSLYRLQEQTGKTNELLGKIDDSLGEIQDGIDDVINGTPEQNEIADNVNDNLNQAGDAVQNAGGQLGSFGDQLSAIDKPDADSFNVSVDGLVPYQALLAYTAPIQTLWENPTLLGMLMIVMTLVIISWVFFGKKG